MNHRKPKFSADGFSGTMIALTISVIMTTLVILGPDGMSLIWDMISPF